MILINNNEYDMEREVSVWELDIPKETVMHRLIQTSEQGYDTRRVEYPVSGGKVRLLLPKTSATVLLL